MSFILGDLISAKRLVAADCPLYWSFLSITLQRMTSKGWIDYIFYVFFSSVRAKKEEGDAGRRGGKRVCIGVEMEEGGWTKRCLCKEEECLSYFMS